MSVSVVICTRDRPELLAQCLEALRRQTHPQFEILVVDNAPAVSAREVCEAAGARYVVEPVAGLSCARNTAAREARGELIAYTDDDAVPDCDWLEKLVSQFAEPSVAAVTGAARYMSAAGNTRFMTDNPTDGPARPYRIFERSERGWFTAACLGRIGDGNNMAFRRHALLAAGGFDERLGRGRDIDGGEEHFAFMKILAAGHRVVCMPAAVVRHPYPCDADQLRALRLQDRRASIAYLAFLWKECPSKRVELAAYLLCASLRRVFWLVTGRRRAELSWPEALSAGASGLRLYARARRRWARSSLERPSRIPTSRGA